MRIIFIVHILLLSTLSVFSQELKATDNNDSIPWSYQVDTPPEFPGGESAFIFFIGKNTILPDSFKCTVSKIYLTFIVDENGKIKDTQIKIPDTRIHCDDTKNTESARTSFIENLLSALKNAPDWKPGKKGDKVLSVKMFFPINIDM